MNKKEIVKGDWKPHPIQPGKDTHMSKNLFLRNKNFFWYELKCAEFCVKAIKMLLKKKRLMREFPSSPVVKTLHFIVQGGPGLIPSQGTRSCMSQLTAGTAKQIKRRRR